MPPVMMMIVIQVLTQKLCWISRFFWFFPHAVSLLHFVAKICAEYWLKSVPNIAQYLTEKYSRAREYFANTSFCICTSYRLLVVSTPAVMTSSLQIMPSSIIETEWYMQILVFWQSETMRCIKYLQFKELGTFFKYLDYQKRGKSIEAKQRPDIFNVLS